MTDTRFLCHNSLENLGKLDVVKSLLKRVGLENFMAKGAHTYRRYTLEFLSTLTFSGESTKNPKITFRLKGKPRSLTYVGLRKAFGIKEMSKEKYVGLNKKTSPKWWNELTGLDTRGKQGEISFYITHPCIRVAHRFVANTFLCNGEPTKLPRVQLERNNDWWWWFGNLVNATFEEGTYFYYWGSDNDTYLKLPRPEDDPLTYGEMTEDFRIDPDPNLDDTESEEEYAFDEENGVNGDRRGIDTTTWRSIATMPMATYDQVWKNEIDAWRKEVDARQVRTDDKLAALSNVLLETHELVRSLNRPAIMAKIEVEWMIGFRLHAQALTLAALVGAAAVEYFDQKHSTPNDDPYSNEKCQDNSQSILGQRADGYSETKLSTKCLLFYEGNMVIPPPIRPPRITEFLKPYLLKMHFTNKFVHAQVIHSPTATIVASASSQEKALRATIGITRDVTAAAKIGKILGECLLVNNIPAVQVFLKREQKYHGKIKAVIDNMRDAGVKLL
ncbi:hypothetical protein KSS87_012393 [Heliosperma pusillum]|nr:hypothetical protein KSS87_012393 [Heliosperma pusillum]